MAEKRIRRERFSVLVSHMPDTKRPVFEPWLSKLKETANQADENTFLVGHSLGCITMLRFLEGLGDGEKGGGAVLVAGFTDNLGYKEIDSFFWKPIGWDNIKQHCKRFVVIHSDNDPYVPLKHGHIFEEKLGARLIVKKGQKHFSGSEGKKELPVALESVLEMQ